MYLVLFYITKSNEQSRTFLKVPILSFILFLKNQTNKPSYFKITMGLLLNSLYEGLSLRNNCTNRISVKRFFEYCAVLDNLYESAAFRFQKMFA